MLGGARKLAVGVALLGLAGGAQAAGSDFPAAQQALGIPTSIATVVDANTTSLPQYILIQDVHRHPEVQDHIAAMLLYGHSAWGLRNVFIEGAFGPIDPAQIESLTTESAPLAERLQEGEISGAEVAAAMAPEHALHLIGIEDENVYKENLAAWARMEDQRDAALRELHTIRFVQNTLDLNSAAFSPDQLDRLELLLRLQLKPAEYAAYLASPRDIATSHVLSDAIETAETFYRLAEERSRIFLERAEAADTSGPKVLVVGGFHTAAMGAALRARGQTYVVLSPRVTESGYDGLYAQRLRESVSALKITSSPDGL